MADTNPLSIKERIVHTLLFEVGAVILSVVVIKLFGSHDTGAATGVSVLMATMAMVWNLVFNYGFDKVFTGDRLKRGVGVRLLHVVLFEGGLVLFTVPVIAWILQVSLWQALMMDIGITLVITVYAFLYNWAFDYVRDRLIRKRV
ncbi:hypothetical protein B0181_06030 [Moraxella caviae]|uniref:Chlorhexidine efflux transporter domain-containing protein n=1 Tax=Moraxella caviae TaxID=34060 RepID=A0A1T0A2N8_9GAMM|nr:hypothetical protein B0181_06030 [Moraxella caviae]